MPKRYKEARLMHKAKLTEMATKLGVSQPTLSAWESERKSAPVEAVIKMATLYDQSVQLDQLHAFEIPELAEFNSRWDPLSVKQYLQLFSAVKAAVVIQRPEANVHPVNHIIIDQYTLFFHLYPPREIRKAE